MGMDAETQTRVFEPFFTTKSPGKGTGLGLATVYGIVKQSGGAISVYSEPERGTTFKLFFPKRTAVVKGGGSEAIEPVLIAPRGGRGTILLVEDEESLRRLTLAMLERHGYRVFTAKGGHEAVALCRAAHGAIDLVLSDMVMPHMSGDQLAIELRRLYPGMKILFMSGYSEHAAVSQALLSPGVPFVSKPFTSGELLGKVNQALNGGSKTAGSGV